jgi:hypothetical protein
MVVARGLRLRYRGRRIESAAIFRTKRLIMGYGIAWLLGVPISILVAWFVITHMF